jgi:hypothetical protein
MRAPRDETAPIHVREVLWSNERDLDRKIALETDIVASVMVEKDATMTFVDHRTPIPLPNRG